MITPDGDVLTPFGREVDPCKVWIEYMRDRNLYLIVCGGCGDEWTVVGYGGAHYTARIHLCAKLERNRLRAAVADLVDQTTTLASTFRVIPVLLLQRTLTGILDSNGATVPSMLTEEVRELIRRDTQPVRRIGR